MLELLPDAPTFLLLVLLGGWSAIDGTSFGQFMISRPFVSATLGGLVMGDPISGAAVGVVLEAFHLTILPIGAARYPEGGPPSVVVGALAAGSSPVAADLLTGLVFYLVWSEVCGGSVRALRKINVRLFIRDGRLDFDPAALERRHLAAIGFDFLRGTALVALGTTIFAALLHLSRASWGLGDRVPQIVIAATVAGLMASVLRLFGDRKRLFVAGAIGGLLVLLARG